MHTWDAPIALAVRKDTNPIGPIAIKLHCIITHKGGVPIEGKICPSRKPIISMIILKNTSCI